MLYELRYSFPVDRPAMGEQIKQALQAAGIPEDKTAESSWRTRGRVSYFAASRNAVTRVRWAAVADMPPGVRSSILRLRKADWQTKWKKGYRPLIITPGVRIVPLWMKHKVPLFAGANIYIDTGLAFGTGLHPSTRLIAGLIAAEQGRFADFLDIGTGTGILSLIARAFACRRLCAFDSEQDAVTTAARNAAANATTFDVLEVRDFTRDPVVVPSDFVAANILAPVLLAMRQALLACVRPGKYLAVSGIWHSDYRRFRASFDMPELRCLKVRREKGWYAVLFRKQE